MPRSPVEGSRLKQTPVPQSSPWFPNTICITLTAVPRSSGISYVVPVDPRTRRVPRVEDGAHGAHQLLVGVLRERRPASSS